VSATPVDESLPTPIEAEGERDASPTSRFTQPARWLPGIAFPLVVWLVWRLLQLALSVYLGGERRLFTALNAAFYYDGERYLQITQHGYLLAEQQMPNTAFFPGVSWLAWPVWQLTRSELWAGHVTATVTGAAAFVTVWGVTREWVDERAARHAVVLLALFPSSLFLWAFYSEGLFIALGAGAVWADRRKRPVLAMLCLFALSTTRSVGVLPALVLALARAVHNRRSSEGESPGRAVDRWVAGYAAAGIAGVLPVLWMMYVYTGDALAFVSVQQDWGRALSPPWVTVTNGVTSLWPDPSTIMVPALVARNLDLWCLLITAVGIAWLAFSRRPRFPMEAWMLGVALVVLPLCSTSLASFNRFVMANWVLYPAYASLLGRLPRWWRRGAWVVVTVALAVTTYHMVGRFSVDRFIG
jgi:hypothetical protein